VEIKSLLTVHTMRNI